MQRYPVVTSFLCSVLIAFSLVMIASQAARADAGFEKWIRGFYSVAAKSGIKKSTYNAVFRGIKSPDPEVLKAARYQPEFTAKVWEYLDTRITEKTIRNGKEMAIKYKKWLNKIEPKFGVSRYVLLAIWSMESSYGEALKKKTGIRSIARSLATLAYLDKRRRKFARTQLIAALKIVQRGDVSAKGLVGSWAGAMGHTQFIPTSYRTWAVDIDGDGRRNVWTSVPDALASSANLLRKNGWRSSQTWGYEVKLPRRFNYKLVNKNGLTLGKFAAMGVKRSSGAKFPRAGDKAVLKLLAGKKGPAFLMVKNFYVLKRYNNADKYALAVGHLAERIKGSGPFVKNWPRGYIPLNESERKELQIQLLQRKLYDGKIDGNIGSGSRAAIMVFQKANGMKATGYASKAVLAKIRGRK
ncbi:MAG: lytic murein transglycosylase [Rhizobiaceae bacterium]|nr:lytic murein transglycosylase [Rhizobiaceae bacterium]